MPSARRPDYHKFDYLGSYFVRFNTTKKPLDDPRVRKAMALAIDKAGLVAKYTKGGERLANHFVPPGTGNYTSPSGPAHDPGLAKRLLAEAGFPEGKGFPTDFEYLFNSSEVNKNIAVELQRMWHETLGIQVKLRQAENKVYLAAQSALDYHVTRSSWIGDYNDPNTFLDMFMTQNGNNRTGWSNAGYDRLIRLCQCHHRPAQAQCAVPRGRDDTHRRRIADLPAVFLRRHQYLPSGPHRRHPPEHPRYPPNQRHLRQGTLISGEKVKKCVLTLHFCLGF